MTSDFRQVGTGQAESDFTIQAVCSIKVSNQGKKVDQKYPQNI